MYTKINDVKGEIKIDLSYPIKNFDFAEIAVVSLFSDNVQYQLLRLIRSWTLFQQQKDDSR